MAKRGTIKKIDSKDIEIRPIRWRKYPYFFLIVCEDEKTEKYYFEHFKKSIPEGTIFLRTVGTGRDPKGVVEQSIKEREKLCLESRKNIDEIWVVFDKDDADENVTKILRFNDAFSIASKETIKIAYSNEVFELWLLLHFRNVANTTPIARKNIYLLLENVIRKYTAYTNFVYEHGNTNVIDAVIKLGNEKKAIERAIKLLNENIRIPLDANPSTTVHLLVLKLRELTDFYSFIPNS